MIDFEFKGYQWIPVYRAMTPEQRAEVIAFWIRNKAIALETAKNRVNEVVYMIRSPEEDLVGVTTVNIMDFISDKRPYYFFRIFVRPEDRRYPVLIVQAVQKTRQFLQNYQNPDGNPNGVVIVAENQKLSRPAVHRILRNNGWNFHGKGPKGNDVWYFNFDGTAFQSPQAG